MILLKYGACSYIYVICPSYHRIQVSETLKILYYQKPLCGIEISEYFIKWLPPSFEFCIDLFVQRLVSSGHLLY